MATRGEELALYQLGLGWPKGTSLSPSTSTHPLVGKVSLTFKLVNRFPPIPSALSWCTVGTGEAVAYSTHGLCLLQWPAGIALALWCLTPLLLPGCSCFCGVAPASPGQLSLQLAFAMVNILKKHSYRVLKPAKIIYCPGYIWKSEESIYNECVSLRIAEALRPVSSSTHMTVLVSRGLEVSRGSS